MSERHGVQDGPAGREAPFSSMFAARRSFPVTDPLPSRDKVVNGQRRHTSTAIRVVIPLPGPSDAKHVLGRPVIERVDARRPAP
jgi:hypothetical protein